MWLAKYINRKTGAFYWRTVMADTVNEATRAANRLTKKGFLCVGVKQYEKRL